MYLGPLLASLNDEKSWGTDSPTYYQSPLYKVQDGWVSYGEISDSLDKDYYQFSVVAGHSYEICLTSDADLYGWSTYASSSFLEMSIVSSTGQELGLKSIIYELYSDVIRFTANVTGSFYVKVSGGFSPADYALTIDDVTPVVLGDANNNTLIGGAGTQILRGLGGDDVLIGAAGGDILEGGAGSDTASYATGTAWVDASLMRPVLNTNSAAGDTYFSVENLIGSKFADGLEGSIGANRINGGAGADFIVGRAAADRLYAGIDDAKDVFAFLAKADSGTALSTCDRIYQFDKKGSGELIWDRIDLSRLDADNELFGDQKFRFVTTFKTVDATKPEGQVRTKDLGADVDVLVDINGDNATDMLIKCVGVGSLGLADLIL